MVSCRPIEVADLPAITDLLHAGFPTRGKRYWHDGLQRLATHQPPPGFARFGYMLESDRTPVGVLLLISTTNKSDDGPTIRCNLSSWYVRPEFRIYAPLLVSRTTKNAAVTYINLSPANHTIPTIAAQGFTTFSTGLFVAAPLLKPRRLPACIGWLPEHWNAARSMPAAARQLLMDHYRYNCIGLWVEDGDGGQPFIFKRRLVTWARVPCAQLIFCPSLYDLERQASAIGRFLAMRRMPLIIVPTERPLRGIVGTHIQEKFPMYFKGPTRPTATDLTYTEAALFGF